jgi:phenylalanine-4-hydroxylase
LKAHNIAIGQTCRLEFLSGITVCGYLRQIHRQEHRSLILSFDDCTVTALDGQLLFDPGWGCYDMAVGATIESVFGGAADREKLQLYQAAGGGSATAEITETGPELMALYEKITKLGGELDEASVGRLLVELDRYSDEWLLRVELLEVLADTHSAARAVLQTQLRSIQRSRPEVEKLIEMAIG